MRDTLVTQNSLGNTLNINNNTMIDNFFQTKDKNEDFSKSRQFDNVLRGLVSEVED